MEKTVLFCWDRKVFDSLTPYPFVLEHSGSFSATYYLTELGAEVELAMDAEPQRSRERNCFPLG